MSDDDHEDKNGDVHDGKNADGHEARNGDVPEARNGDVYESRSDESFNHDLQSIYTAYKGPLSQFLIRRFQTDFIEADESTHDFLTERLCPEWKFQAYIAKYREKKSQTPGMRFRDYLRTSALNFYIDKVRKRTRISDALKKLLETGYLGDGVLYETPMERERFDHDCAISIFNKAINDARDHCREQGREADLWYIIKKKFFEPLRDGQPSPGVGELAEGLVGIPPAKISNLVVTAHRCLHRALVQALVAWEGLDVIESDQERGEAFQEALVRLRERLLELQGDANSSRQINDESGFFVGDESSLGSKSATGTPEAWMENPTAVCWELHLQSSLQDVVATWHEWSPKATETDWNPLKSVKRQKLKDLLFPTQAAGTVSLPVLKALRDAAKSFGWDVHRQVEAAKRGRDSESREKLKSRRKILEAMYLVPIAAARVHHDAKLSTDDDGKFAKRFGKIWRAGWLDSSSEALIREWMIRFSPDSPAAS
jgi:hypothetical protein